MTVFTFRAGNSPLHLLDPRTKFILTAVLSVTAFSAGPAGALSATAAVIVGLAVTGLPLIQAVRELKIFVILGLFMFFSRM